MSESIEKTIRQLSEQIAKEIDLIYLRQIGKLILKHEDLRRFLASRLEMHVSHGQPQITMERNIRLHFLLNQSFKMVYVNQGIWGRLCFYIFDISLWLKRKIEGCR